MKQKKKCLFMVAALLFALAFLASCAAAPPAPEDKPPQGEAATQAAAGEQAGQETEATAQTGGGAKPLEGKKIGVSLYYMGDEWYVNVSNELKKQAEALGAELILQDANAQPETQSSQLENFITQQCDMIMLAAVDPEGVATTLDNVAQAGIPVVAFDEPPIWDKTLAFVAWDNKETGIAMGEYVKKYIDENLDGKANIAIIELVASPLCMARAEGFLEGLGDMGGDIKVVSRQDAEASEEKAANIISNISEPIDVVFSVTDPGAFGAVTALEAMSADGVKVFSCGGYGERTLSLLKDKNPYYEAVVVIPPHGMVESMMDVAVNYFAGQEDRIEKEINTNYVIADQGDYSSLE